MDDKMKTSFSELDVLELIKEYEKKIEEAYHKGYSDGYDAKAMEVEEDML